MMETGSDPFAQFDAVQARLEAITATARANTAGATILADEAGTAESTARSPGGEVTVTSRAGGVITAMNFSDASLKLAPAALARIAISTIAQAQHAAASRFADVAAEQLGASSALATSLRADAENAFPLPDGGGIQY